MGVPALFRWLSQKYPKIISPVIEKLPEEVDGVKIPVNHNDPNPNGEEFDNLYLDMNGIVHPCSHPEDGPAPANEKEMMMAIFDYTDRIIGMVRPRKLLMIAVDGVAPRAKMNQQRSRRFRSAKEAKEKEEQMKENAEEFAKLLKQQGKTPTTEQVVKKIWDSNSITPGTPFMHLLADSLRYYAVMKLNLDPSWEKRKIIISDASVPGEGEHKIMNFIRSQRQMPGYDPNTHHVIYGLDADLIMLGLATHEPHFRVLREDVFFQSRKEQLCRNCQKPGHKMAECPGVDAEDDGSETEGDKPLKPFIWLHVPVLREYLAVEMDAPGRTFPFDLERAIDDWVFMCFFVGNDFLPHLPSLEIREEGIRTLLDIWRDMVPRMNSYVTKNGFPNLERVQQILAALGRQEDRIFRKRKENEERSKRARAERERKQNGGGPPSKRARMSGGGNAEEPVSTPPYRKVKESTATYANVPFFLPKDAQSNEVRNLHHDMMVNRNQPIGETNAANKSAAAALKAMMSGNKDTATTADESPATTLGKRKAGEIDSSDSGTPGRNTPNPKLQENQEPETPEDTIRLWEEGYADRYYEQKFHKDPKDIEFRHQVGRAYAEGLCWVLHYYMQGCPSWTWYYPYHYAPFAKDFVGIDKMKIKFNKGKIFRPYEQLMGVLPAASNHAIPEAFRPLMSDKDSPILDFYPVDFPIDLNGKKFAWQGVAILPFIDENRLLEAMNTKYPELSDDEVKRNEHGKEVVMWSYNHPLTNSYEVVEASDQKQGSEKECKSLNNTISENLFGSICHIDEHEFDTVKEAPFKVDEGEANDDDEESRNVPDKVRDTSMRFEYVMPPSNGPHKSVLLLPSNSKDYPKPVLDDGDREFVRGRIRHFRQDSFAMRQGDDRNNRHSNSYGNGYGNGRGRGGGHRGGRGGASWNGVPPSPLQPGANLPPIPPFPPGPPPHWHPQGGHSAGWAPPAPQNWNGPPPRGPPPSFNGQYPPPMPPNNRGGHGGNRGYGQQRGGGAYGRR